jgi:putative flippase GtrA
MKRLYFLVRYGITGVAGGVIQTLFLYVWVTLFGFEKTYLLGLIFGFILALIVTFLLQKYWTFRDRESKHIPHQLLLYSTVALSGLALNAVLLAGAKAFFSWIGVDFFHVWYLIVQVGIFFVVSAFNLCMNFLVTFRHARQKNLHGT